MIIGGVCCVGVAVPCVTRKDADVAIERCYAVEMTRRHGRGFFARAYAFVELH